MERKREVIRGRMKEGKRRSLVNGVTSKSWNFRNKKGGWQGGELGSGQIEVKKKSMKGVKRKLKLMWSLYPTVVVYTFSEKKFCKITNFMVFSLPPE